MTNNFTVNGVTYDLDFLAEGDGGRGYAKLTVPGTGSQSKPFYIAVMEDALADAGRVLKTTSSTSLTIGTGNQVFVTDIALAFTEGTYITLSDTAAPSTNHMTGIVTSASGTSITINIASTDDTSGSGTKTSWNVASVGKPGVVGPSGSLDINGLAAEDMVSPDDEIVIFDLSVAENRKVLIDDLAITMETYSRLFI